MERIDILREIAFIRHQSLSDVEKECKLPTNWRFVGFPWAKLYECIDDCTLTLEVSMDDDGKLTLYI